MAKLLIQSDGFENRPFVLRLGVNAVGRNPDCDFQIDHSTVSSRHCELILSAGGLVIRDCNSTNGTFVNDAPVKEATLQPGQIVRVGDVELFVESAEVTVAIPKVQQHEAVPVGVGSPPVLPPGANGCGRHPGDVATYQCTVCNEFLCGKCARTLRRQGGQSLFFCPICNGRCRRLNVGPPKKKTFLDTLRKTVKLPFASLTGRAKR